MRAVLICPDDLLEHVVTAAAFPGERPLYLVSRREPARAARPAGRPGGGRQGDGRRRSCRGLQGRARSGGGGGPRRPARAGDRGGQGGGPRRARCWCCGRRAARCPNATVVPLSAFGERIVQPALERATQRARAERLRAHFYDAERVLILMQDDPDPDAIASALALKTLLGRTRASAPHVHLRHHHAARERGHVQDPRDRGRGDRRGGARPVRPRGDGGRAALVPGGGEALRRGGPGDRPSSGGAADPGAHQGRAPVLRRDLHHHGRVPARGRREDHPAAGHRAALRHQVGHPRPRARRHQGRPRGLRVPLPPRQPQCAPPHRAAGAVRRPPWTSSPRAWPSGASSTACSSRTWVGSRPWTSSPSSPTSGCRPRAWSGRWSPGVVGDEVHVSVRNVGYVRSAGDVDPRRLRRARHGGRAPDHGQGGVPAAPARPRRRAIRPRAAHARSASSSASCGRWAATANPEGSPS